MKIRFRQTGGFAGLNFGCDLDTASMPASEAKKLLDLVKKSQLSERSHAGSKKGRDLGNYEITVTDDPHKVTTTFDDMSVPKQAQALLDFLRERARPQPLE
ncbi:MAG: hypothetical protein HGB11_10000 [Chlorobiales bacterium]|nr:hypothetical protein [Chlorobiales bacterium]